MRIKPLSGNWFAVTLIAVCRLKQSQDKRRAEQREREAQYEWRLKQLAVVNKRDVPTIAYIHTNNPAAGAAASKPISPQKASAVPKLPVCTRVSAPLLTSSCRHWGKSRTHKGMAMLCFCARRAKTLIAHHCRRKAKEMEAVVRVATAILAIDLLWTLLRPRSIARRLSKCCPPHLIHELLRKQCLR